MRLLQIFFNSYFNFIFTCYNLSMETKTFAITIPKHVAKRMKTEGKRRGFVLSKIWLEAAEHYFTCQCEPCNDFPFDGKAFRERAAKLLQS